MRISRSPLLAICLLGFVLQIMPSISRADDAPKLTKDDGPFMVMAYEFRGDDAETRAKALAAELRKDHGLPSFIHHRSAKSGGATLVLVGNCKSTKEAFVLKNRVKKLDAKILVDQPTQILKGLSRAIVVTNPLVEPEMLIPKPPK